MANNNLLIHLTNQPLVFLDLPYYPNMVLLKKTKLNQKQLITFHWGKKDLLLYKIGILVLLFVPTVNFLDLETFVTV